MKAAVCERLGGPEGVVIRERVEPVPGPEEVLVSVEYAGVNFPDVLVVAGRYQTRHDPPFVPGHELAGTVRAVGSAVEGLAPGHRVVANVAGGAFAERVVVPARAAIPLPDGVSAELAAAMHLTYGTAYHGLVDRARLAPGETLAVLGAAGGVGDAAVQVGKALGARVVAVASTEAKRRFASDRGADHALSADAEDLKSQLRAASGRDGIDVLLDPVGGPWTEPALRSLRWGGRHLVVGFASGEIPRPPLNVILLKGCSLVGVFWGRFVQEFPEAHRRNTEQLFAWVESDQIRPPEPKIMELDDVARALTELAARRVRGKILLRISSGGASK
jgi:NADPH2:quinone reductase